MGQYSRSKRAPIISSGIFTRPIGLSLIEKFMKEYIEEQTKAELIRQDLLNRYKPEGIIVRYNIDLVNNKLIVFTGEEQ